MEMDFKEIVSNDHVYNLENAIRGAKLPMNTDSSKLNEEITPGITKLAQSPKGEGHDQWLSGILVTFDLTASVKMWTEMERYRFVTFTSLT